MRIYVHGVPIDAKGGEVIEAGDGLSKDGNTIDLTNPIRGIYTLAQWGALSPEEKLDGTYIVDDKYSGSSDSNDYSTEERRVGTWMNKKPVYRQTFIGVLPDSKDQVVPGLHVPDMERWLSLSAFCNIGSAIYPIPYASASGDANLVYIGDGGFSFYGTHTAFFGKEFICTIEYTKTTDLEVSE